MRQLKITKQITNRNTASLDKYLQEIAKVPLITAQEEVELRRLDQVARDLEQVCRNLLPGRRLHPSCRLLQEGNRVRRKAQQGRDEKGLFRRIPEELTKAREQALRGGQHIECDPG